MKYKRPEGELEVQELKARKIIKQLESFSIENDSYNL